MQFQKMRHTYLLTLSILITLFFSSFAYADFGINWEEPVSKKEILTIKTLSPTGEIYTNLVARIENDDLSSIQYVLPNSEGEIVLENFPDDQYKLYLFPKGPEGYVLKDYLRLSKTDQGWQQMASNLETSTITQNLEQGVLLSQIIGDPDTLKDQNFYLELVTQNHPLVTTIYAPNQDHKIYVSPQHTGPYMTFLKGFDLAPFGDKITMGANGQHVTLAAGAPVTPLEHKFFKTQAVLSWDIPENQDFLNLFEGTPLSHGMRVGISPIDAPDTLLDATYTFKDNKQMLVAGLNKGQYKVQVTWDFTLNTQDETQNPHKIEWHLNTTLEIGDDQALIKPLPVKLRLIKDTRIGFEALTGDREDVILLKAQYKDPTTGQVKIGESSYSFVLSTDGIQYIADSVTQEGRLLEVGGLKDGKYVYKVLAPEVLDESYAPIYLPFEVKGGKFVNPGQYSLTFQKDTPNLIIEVYGENAPYEGFFPHYWYDNENVKCYLSEDGSINDYTSTKIGNKVYLRFRGDLKFDAKMHSTVSDLFLETEISTFVIHEGKLLKDQLKHEIYNTPEQPIDTLKVNIEKGIHVLSYSKDLENKIYSAIFMHRRDEEVMNRALDVKPGGLILSNPVVAGFYYITFYPMGSVSYGRKHIEINSLGQAVGQPQTITAEIASEFTINTHTKGSRAFLIYDQDNYLYSYLFGRDVLGFNGYDDGTYTIEGSIYGSDGKPVEAIDNPEGGLKLTVQEGVYTLSHSTASIEGVNHRSGLSILANDRPEATELLAAIAVAKKINLDDKSPTTKAAFIKALSDAKALFKAPQPPQNYKRALTNLQVATQQLSKIQPVPPVPPVPTVPPVTPPSNGASPVSPPTTTPIVTTPISPVPSTQEETTIKDEQTPQGAFIFKGSYIKGFEDGTFRPEAQLTRAEFARILATVLGLENNAKRESSNSQPNRPWYQDSVDSLVTAKIMKLDAKGQFRPKEAITRMEIVEAIVNYWTYIGKELPNTPVPFSDIKGEDQKSLVSKVYGAGIINGFEDNTFRPEASATRAQAIKMINLLIERKPLAQLPQTPRFKDLSINHWAYTMIEAAVTGE